MKTALIIGAHPDDAILGVGGTAILLRRRGWRVVVLTATKGEQGGLDSTREAEESESMALLNFLNHQGALRDGALDLDSSLKLIEPFVNEYRPNAVFMHAPDDTHQDHRTLTQAGVIATRGCPLVFYFEGPSTQQFSPIAKVDIEPAWEEKLAAIRVYRSQTSRLDLIRWAESTSRFRSWPETSTLCVEAFQPYRISLNLGDEDWLGHISG
jgi:LmbE family N-acetylglucosaminyl deacetylase